MSEASDLQTLPALLDAVAARYPGCRREDELPLRSSGKVDKAVLRAEAARLAGP
jgi:hypothetical protein